MAGRDKRQLEISTGLQWASTCRVQQVGWRGIVHRLSNPGVSKLLQDDYDALPPHRKLASKASRGWYLPGRFADNRRSLANLEHRTAITLDFDGLEGARDIEAVVGVLKKAGASPGGPEGDCDGIPDWPFTWVAHTTRGHRPEKPKVRVVIPLAEPVFPEHYGPLARLVADFMFPGMPGIDPVSFRPGQISFWPTVSTDQEFWLVENDSPDRPWLDPAPFLQPWLDDDGHVSDLAGLPRADGEEEVFTTRLRKRKDPTERPGVAGQFNRWVGSVDKAIEMFLPDVYEPVDADRYRHRDSTGAPGAIVYDDGKFLYSHHGTDPAGGQLCDAFDLVRLHKFGHLDEAKQVPREAAWSERPSVQAMLKFVQEHDGFREWRRKAWTDGFAADDVPAAAATTATTAAASVKHEEPVKHAPSALAPPASRALDRLFGGARKQPRLGSPCETMDALLEEQGYGRERLLLALAGLEDNGWLESSEYRDACTRAAREQMASLLDQLALTKKGEPAKTPENQGLVLRMHPLLNGIAAVHPPGPRQGAPRVVRPVHVAPGAVWSFGRRLDAADAHWLAAVIASAPDPERAPFGCGVRFAPTAIRDIIEADADRFWDRVVPVSPGSVTREISPPAVALAMWLRRLADDWDGEARGEELFVRWLGAKDNPFNRAAAKVFLAGMVARAFRPGVKFDYMLVLAGRQGIRKSTLLRLLVPGEDWFTELESPSITARDVLERLSGKWLVELAEMAALKGREADQVKTFITRQEDEARRAYARRTELVPRAFVLAGTTNETHMLDDDTGNRRFLIVPVEGVADFSREAFLAERDQILGEAAHRWLAAESEQERMAQLVLPPELWPEQQRRAEKARGQSLPEYIGGLAAAYIFPSRPVRQYAGWREQLDKAVYHGDITPAEAQQFAEAPAWRTWQTPGVLDRDMREDSLYLRAASSARGRVISLGRWLAGQPSFRVDPTRRRLYGQPNQMTCYEAALLGVMDEEHRRLARACGFVLRDWVDDATALAWAAGRLVWRGDGRGVETLPDDGQPIAAGVEDQGNSTKGASSARRRLLGRFRPGEDGAA